MKPNSTHPLSTFLLSFFLLASIPLASAQTNIDSLWTTWEDESQADTVRLHAMADFIEKAYLLVQPDSAIYYAELMYDFALERDSFYTANALGLQGAAMAKTGDFMSAFDHFDQSLAIYTALNEEIEMAQAMKSLAITYGDLSDYANSMKYFTMAMEIAERKGREDLLSVYLNSIGSLHNVLGRRGEAKQYFLRGLKYAERADMTRGKALCHTNLAVMYAYATMDDSVYFHVDKAIQFYRQLGDSIGVTRAIARKGLLHKFKGEYEKALPFFLEILSKSERVGNMPTASAAIDEIARLYMKMGDFEKAEQYAIRSLEIAESINSLIQILRSHDVLYKIYEKTNNHAKALEALEHVVAFQDSLVNEENHRELIHQEYRYNYLRKSVADSVRNEEEKKVTNALIAQERAENAQYKSQQIILFGGIGLLILFLTYLYNRFIIMSKQKKLIEEQKKQVEEQKVIIEESSKAKLELERLKQEHLKADLTNAAQEISRRQEWLEQFKTKLQKVKSLVDKKEELNVIFIDIANQMQVDARNQEFYKNIDTVNREFFYRLKEKFPSITQKEQELSGLIRLNLSTKEIASVRNVAPHSVRIARSRLRKRLGLETEDNLYDFLQKV